MRLRNVSKRHLVSLICARSFGSITVKTRRRSVRLTALCKRRSLIFHTMCHIKDTTESWIPTTALQTSAHKPLTARTLVRTSSGRMDHTDSTPASNVTNATLDQCSRSSLVEPEETLALPVLSRDQQIRNLLLVITTESEKIRNEKSL